ncbi:basic leucine zipper 19-like [Aristolochia californica]|uniref:basic leucine zipper 19-like n=1 Tax=Aristolochia californica TaxID=171875 RepID=UPI0035DE5A98
MLIMEEGEEELSEQFVISSSHFHEPPTGNLLDELLKTTRTCTHTHTCNPPGPSAAHTHTCYHTHTQVIPNGEENGSNSKQHSLSKSRKPLGNREAVRKYREKKKAHTAYLEEEVKKLHLLNQQLLRKLQGQALLEAEVMRLRTLLLDLRGKIDSELGVFPFQKQCNSPGLKEGGCGVACETDSPCLHQNIGSSLEGVGGNEKISGWEGTCEPPIVSCRANLNSDMGGVMENNETHLDHFDVKRP